jgi:type IV secretion system protein VirB10
MNEANQEPANADIDRGIAPVNGRQVQGGGKLWLIAIALVAMLAVIYFIPGGAPSKVASDAGKSRAGRSTDSEYTDPNRSALGQPARQSTAPIMPTFTAPTIPTIEKRPDIKTVTSQGSSRELTPAQRRMRGGLTSTKKYGSGRSGSPKFEDKPPDFDQLNQQLATLGKLSGGMGRGAGQANAAAKRSEVKEESFAASLETTGLKGSNASRIANVSLTIARGRLFECVLDTAISSVVTGQVRCTVPDDVYGEDGKLVMLDRGTEVVGEYKSDLQDGEPRLGVIWTRAKTPGGVVINLGSPATDPLGRGGVSGQVETFFWRRFGAAIMLSILDDTLAAVAAGVRERNRSGDGQIYINNSSRGGRDLAGIALDRSLNIRPVLVKNQGESVAVFLARDLSFKDVYEHRQLGVR